MDLRGNDVVPEDIDQFLLDTRELSEIVIVLGGQEDEGESSEVERAGDHFRLAVDEDIGGRSGLDTG
jgi:hypothetical protein